MVLASTQLTTPAGNLPSPILPGSAPIEGARTNGRVLKSLAILAERDGRAFNLKVGRRSSARKRLGIQCLPVLRAIHGETGPFKLLVHGAAVALPRLGILRQMSFGAAGALYDEKSARTLPDSDNLNLRLIDM
jgi:hypothetical protein